MSSNTKQANTTSLPEKSYFDQQRESLIKEIAIGFENVLQNINKLNRSLEGVIAVGNEFGSVEALWSQFEHVMAKGPEAEEEEGKDEEGGEEVDGEGEEGEGDVGKDH